MAVHGTIVHASTPSGPMAIDHGIQADLDATIERLNVAPTEQLGTVGFCVGARAVFRTLMRLPERFVAGAMWHPSFLVDDQPDSPHVTARRLTRPLFGRQVELLDRPRGRRS